MARKIIGIARDIVPEHWSKRWGVLLSLLIAVGAVVTDAAERCQEPGRDIASEHDDRVGSRGDGVRVLAVGRERDLREPAQREADQHDVFGLSWNRQPNDSFAAVDLRCRGAR